MTDSVTIPPAETDESADGGVGPAVYNPFDPAFRSNPYPFYDRLRAESPAHVTQFGLTVITRYDDVSHTLRSNDFSRDVEKNGTPRDDLIASASASVGAVAPSRSSTSIRRITPASVGSSARRSPPRRSRRCA